MAGGQPIERMGYLFTARPLSRWRRLTHDFLPYWQGSSPRFVLTVKRQESAGQGQQLNLHWFVRFATHDATEGEIVVPPLEPGKTREFTIGDKFLGFTGDTLIVLPTDLSSSSPDLYHTVYAFHTTPKTWLALVAAATFLGGLFAAFGHWLFGL